MNKLKFLHCADIHMDAPFASLSDAEGKSYARRQDQKTVFRKIIQITKVEKSDLLLICGDLYEQNYIKKSTIGFINDCFSEISDTRVVIIPGNHDPYTQDSYYRNCCWSSNVNILTVDKPYVYFEDLDTYVYGIGMGHSSQRKVLEYSVKPVNENSINILLAHGTVDMTIGSNHYNPMNSSNLASLGMDYIALGHFHNRIDDIGKTSLIYNPGSPEPLGFDEPGEHGIYNVCLEKSSKEEVNRSISFTCTSERFYENIDFNVSDFNSNESIADNVLKSIEDKFSSNGLFSITLKGYTEQGFKIEPELISSNLMDKLFYTKIKDETAVEYNFDSIMNEPGLKGLFTRKIFHLIEKTDDDYEKKLLMKALYYGLEALEQGRVDI